ncbi:MAG: GNAT family N-acetyltransferase [Alphaproteobacteria bacterium]|nr:GNAT family N-acetyltransferase [Alphaproteobacteria bacterium]
MASADQTRVRGPATARLGGIPAGISAPWTSSATQAGYVAASRAASIFHRPWWLDAVTDGEWQAVESQIYAGVSAWLPVYIERRFGRALITMPPLTRTLGPIFSETKTASSPASRMRARHLALTTLLRKLPPHLAFEQTFAPDFDDFLPFLLRGYRVGLATCTFRLQSCTDLDVIWHGMRDKTRNVIRRAAERFDVRLDVPPLDFVPFYFGNAGRRSWLPLCSRTRLEKLVGNAVRAGAGTVLNGVRRDGSVAAAIFVAWDNAYMYYLASSRDERIADNGVVSLLIWHAIRMAHQAGLSFDFDSYPNTTGLNFIRQFGGAPVPRWKAMFAPAAVRVAFYLEGRIRKTLYRFVRAEARLRVA